MQYYYCKHCGNIIQYSVNKSVPVQCCGEVMEELIPNTSDAAKEKHLPTVKKYDNVVEVCVGTITHPMLEEHFIQWIEIETRKGSQKKNLMPGEIPNAKFLLTSDDDFVAAYGYCNLHGLWKCK